MDAPFDVTPEISVLPAHFPIPGFGLLPINAFVLKAAEPVLVDAGLGIHNEAFMKALESIIAPADLRWIWITHDDADHLGSFRSVLKAAPKARVVVNALAALRISTVEPVALERIYWLNPGEKLDVGDRKLAAFRPPLFDNPTAIGIFDEKSGACVTVDCFGAIIPAPVRDAAKLAETDLIRGMGAWSKADSPWIHLSDPAKFGKELDKVRRMNPDLILSSHLAPVRNRTERFLELLAGLADSEPFVAPNQSALEAIITQMKSGALK